MSDATKELHNSLIRAAKAALAAWERWLKAKEKGDE
ncbi:hypothetical protein PS627_00089 [Pseudomonas fluorescens]|nr:hypothetical protein PS627_00089 [Pseudomonas fluorescens]